LRYRQAYQVHVSSQVRSVLVNLNSVANLNSKEQKITRQLFTLKNACRKVFDYQTPFPKNN